MTVLRIAGVLMCLPGLLVAAALGPPPKSRWEWLFLGTLSAVIYTVAGLMGSG